MDEQTRDEVIMLLDDFIHKQQKTIRSHLSFMHFLKIFDADPQ